MSIAHPLTLDATCAADAYRLMRGPARMAWLREQASHVENGHPSTAEQRAALAAIAFITKASESATVRDLGQRLLDALARVNGFEEQAKCDVGQAEPDNHLEAQAIAQAEQMPPSMEDEAQDIADFNAGSAAMRKASKPQWTPAMTQTDDGPVPVREDLEDQTEAFLTNAPEAYDGFGTWTVSRCDDGQRLVRIYHDHLEWQTKRYASGGFVAIRAAVAPQPEPILATGETAQDFVAACVDSAGLNQPAEFDGLSEAAVRVFHAILRTIGERPVLYFDEIPVAELGRMTVGQIRQAADELQAANILDQLNPAGALHQVSIRPGLAGRIKEGLVRLPLPTGTADPVAPRKARQPRQPGQAASGGGGCYARITETMLAGDGGSLRRSHKCLNRRVLIVVLAFLRQTNAVFSCDVYRSPMAWQHIEESADACAATGTLALPAPSSSYRPTAWKAAKLVAV